MNATAALSPSTSSSPSSIVPTKLAHYVIRAKRFDAMLAWYRTVLHLRTAFEAPIIAFLTFDEEHHRIAFVNTQHLPEQETNRTGIDHVAFTYASLSDLMHTWERLKAQGITPFWCINHGPTTSMYYRDPDGNQIELQIENFPSAEQANAWFASPAFAANPLGVDFDPRVLFDKFRAGTPLEQLLQQGAAPVPPEKVYIPPMLPPPPA